MSHAIEWMDEWMDGWMDGWMAEWLAVWMDGRMVHGWMHGDVWQENAKEGLDNVLQVRAGRERGLAVDRPRCVSGEVPRGCGACVRAERCCGVTDSLVPFL